MAQNPEAVKLKALADGYAKLLSGSQVRSKNLRKQIANLTEQRRALALSQIEKWATEIGWNAIIRLPGMNGIRLKLDSLSKEKIELQKEQARILGLYSTNSVSDLVLLAEEKLAQDESDLATTTSAFRAIQKDARIDRLLHFEDMNNQGIFGWLWDTAWGKIASTKEQIDKDAPGLLKDYSYNTLAGLKTVIEERKQNNQSNAEAVKRSRIKLAELKADKIRLNEISRHLEAFDQKVYTTATQIATKLLLTTTSNAESLKLFLQSAPADSHTNLKMLLLNSEKEILLDSLANNLEKEQAGLQKSAEGYTKWMSVRKSPTFKLTTANERLEQRKLSQQKRLASIQTAETRIIIYNDPYYDHYLKMEMDHILWHALLDHHHDLHTMTPYIAHGSPELAATFDANPVQVESNDGETLEADADAASGFEDASFDDFEADAASDFNDISDSASEAAADAGDGGTSCGSSCGSSCGGGGCGGGE